MRVFAVALSILLLDAAAPERTAPGEMGRVTPLTDRAFQLAGTWSCRGGYGDVTRLSYRPDGDGFVETQSSTEAGGPDTVTRFRHEATGGWRVERAYRGGGFDGTAPAWSGDTWPVSGVSYQHWDGKRHEFPAPTEQYQLVGGGMLRISHIDVHTAQFTPFSVCARGEAPPDASICVAPELPAIVVGAVEPDMPQMAVMQRISGQVVVLVSIDANDHVVGTRIKSSAYALLNLAALNSARQSRYHTARHDCKPVPSEYEFTVDFSSQ